jgi:hypothetical protein
MNGGSAGISQIARWTRRRIGFAGAGALSAWLGLGSLSSAGAKSHNHHKRKGKGKHKQHGRTRQEQAALIAVGGSGVGGFVTLRQPPSQSGPDIAVQATGLMPGAAYYSLFYDNSTCQLEPYSAEDYVGGLYMADATGNGQTQGRADDDIAQIGSVSVRLASTFALVACAALK